MLAGRVPRRRVSPAIQRRVVTLAVRSSRLDLDRDARVRANPGGPGLSVSHRSCQPFNRSDAAAEIAGRLDTVIRSRPFADRDPRSAPKTRSCTRRFASRYDEPKFESTCARGFGSYRASGKLPTSFSPMRGQLGRLTSGSRADREKPEKVLASRQVENRNHRAALDTFCRPAPHDYSFSLRLISSKSFKTRVGTSA